MGLVLVEIFLKDVVLIIDAHQQIDGFKSGVPVLVILFNKKIRLRGEKMRTVYLIIAITLMLGLSINCSSNRSTENIEVKPDSLNLTKQATALPDKYVNDHPFDWDVKTFGRYDLMIISPIERFHRVHGTMPKNLPEFFESDFCFVQPLEQKSGQLFKASALMDINHPEYLVYEYIDEDTANLSFCLFTMNDEPYVFTYQWSRKRFWNFFPRDGQGRDEDEWANREKTKPPTTTKKAKEMLDQFAKIFGWAMADYFDDNNSFPDSFDILFKNKWGVFRYEPWRDFEYDDPVKKLPNKIFGFDKGRNVYYVYSIWEDFEYKYAMQLPANFIEEDGNPLNMRQIKDTDSLNITFFADAESLRNLASESEI